MANVAAFEASMKTLFYEQHWLMSDWIQDDTGLADRVFYSQPEIAWLIEQGYKPEFSRMADLEMETMRYMMKFRLSEDDYLLLLLKWPNHLCQQMEI